MSSTSGRYFFARCSKKASMVMVTCESAEMSRCFTVVSVIVVFASRVRLVSSLYVRWWTCAKVPLDSDCVPKGNGRWQGVRCSMAPRAVQLEQLGRTTLPGGSMVDAHYEMHQEQTSRPQQVAHRRRPGLRLAAPLSTVQLPVAELRTDPLVRLGPLDAGHVASLAEVPDRWPPIVVD